jgi:hypothetical protein
MDIIHLGQAKLRPPKMKADPTDPFLNIEYAGQGRSRFQDVLKLLSNPKLSNYSYSDAGPAIWLPMILGVPLHTDKGGLCMAYCARGTGMFYTTQSYKETLEVISTPVEAGDVLIFDDRLPHSFDVKRRTDLLVFNVTEKEN